MIRLAFYCLKFCQFCLLMRKYIFIFAMLYACCGAPILSLTGRCYPFPKFGCHGCKGTKRAKRY